MIGILIITGIFLYGAFKIRGEVILQDMLPYDHPYLKLHNRFAEVFGSGGSTVAIALKANKGDIFNPSFLTKLQKMTNEVMMWDEVIRSLTVSIAARSVKVVRTLKKGEINIEPIMWPDIPKTPKEMDALKLNIFSNPAYNGSLVSRDGTAALLLTEFKENISYERVFDILQKLRKDYTDGETSVHIVGFPMLMGWIYSLKAQIFNGFCDQCHWHDPGPGHHFLWKFFGHDCRHGKHFNPDHMGARIYWLHRDKLQSHDVCLGLFGGRPDGRKRPSDHLPLL